MAPLRPQFFLPRFRFLALLALVLLLPHPVPAAASETQLTPLPAEFPKSLPDGRVRLLALDLGPAGPTIPGVPRFGATERRGNYAWVGGLVRDQASSKPAVPLSGGFVEGEDATFVVGVEGRRGSCLVYLVLGNPDRDSGPVDVLVGPPGDRQRLLAEGVGVPRGEPGVLVFEAEPADGRLYLRLRSRDCSLWAATGLFILAPPGLRQAPLSVFSDARPPVPKAADVRPLDRPETLKLLRTACNFLLRERLSDGGFSPVGAWYQNAYPIRTLLAGGRLLGTSGYTEVAVAQLDRFVALQREDGGWYSTYFGSERCQLAPGRADTASSNLADLGTMSLCLAVAAPHVDPERATRYLEAARRYADRVVLPEQLPDGSFPNRRWMGRDYRNPYSVATATQASSLAALGLATGESRYLEAALRAGLWLADSIHEQGTIAFRSHDRDGAQLLRAQDFGDAFYLVEALTWVLAAADRLSGDAEAVAAASVRGALGRYIWGSRGLAASAMHGYWWRPRSMWTSSKMAAVPYILARWRHAGDADREAQVDAWIGRALAWLADPGLGPRIGVLVPWEAQNGEYGLVATGFAGIGIAESLAPGVLLPPDPSVEAPPADAR